MTSSTYFSFIGWVSADQVKLLQAVARNSGHVQNWDPSRTDAKRRATARNWVASQCTSKKWLAHETKRNEMNCNATNWVYFVSFQFVAVHFVSFRFVDLHWLAHELNCNELQQTGSEQFQVVATQFLLPTNHVPSAVSPKIVIGLQFRQILETTMWTVLNVTEYVACVRTKYVPILVRRLEEGN